MNGITSFQQAGDLRQFGRAQCELNYGRKEVQRLAPEKVHGSHRFEKERGRRGHTARHDGVGHPFKQGQVLRCEVVLFWSNGEGVPEIGSKIL